MSKSRSDDTRTGLPSDVMPTLFNPFVTTKSHGSSDRPDDRANHRSTANGGTIQAYNNPDGGATFTVTLPRGANGDGGQRHATACRLPTTTLEW